MSTSTVVRRAPGRPRDQGLPQRRKTEILNTAVLMFARFGYPNTDLQRVADELGVGKGTLYRYFSSKEELFLAAVRRGVDELFGYIDSRVEVAQDALERLRVAVAAYIEFFQQHSELAELFVQERAEFRQSRLPVFFEARSERRVKWEKVLHRLIAERRVRKVPVARVLDVLSNTLYGTMFTNHFLGDHRPVQAQADDIIDVLFHGILQGSDGAGQGGERT